VEESETPIWSLGPHVSTVVHQRPAGCLSGVQRL